MKSSNSSARDFFLIGGALIFFIVMIIAGNKSPQWEESYDTTLISKHEVLDISRQTFELLLKQGIKSKGVSPERYLLRLFGGDPGKNFTDDFRRRGGPIIIRGGRLGRSGYWDSGLIHVERFEHLSETKLTVDVSMQFYGNNTKMKVIYEKKAYEWKLISIENEKINKMIRD